jgi:hypothetical protein
MNYLYATRLGELKRYTKCLLTSNKDPCVIVKLASTMLRVEQWRSQDFG